MTLVFIAFYTLGCGLAAALAANHLSSRVAGNSASFYFATVTAFFFTVFQLGFTIPGLVALAGLSVPTDLRTASALVTLLIAAEALLRCKGACSTKTSSNFENWTASWASTWRELSAMARFSLLATAAVFLLVGLMLSMQFPRGFEVAAYHLPNAVHILQTGSLVAWDSYFPHTYPLGGSLYFAYLLLLLPEKIVSAANLIFLPIIYIATYSTARSIGADRSAATIASAGVLSIPIVAFSSFELGTDIGAFSFLALAIYFATNNRIGPAVGSAMSGVCIGLAFSFKTLHLISLGYLGLVALVRGTQAARETPMIGRLRTAARSAALFALSAALVSGYWLLRNWLQFSNPLYPVSVPFLSDLLGWQSAPDVDFSNRHSNQYEWVRNSFEWFVYPWFEWHAHGQNFKHSSGLGAYFAAAMPASLLLSLLAFLRTPRSGANRNILLIGVLSIVAAWWVLDDRQPRYLMGAVALAGPLCGWALSHVKQSHRRPYEVLLSLCIATMLFVIFSREVFEFGSRVIISHQNTRSEYYEYPDIIDHLPSGSVILNLDERTWHYPLAGRNLENRVVSTPAARGILGLPPSLGPIEEATIAIEGMQGFGVTHVFFSKSRMTLGPCVSAREVGRVAVNPANGLPLEVPRVIAALEYCR